MGELERRTVSHNLNSLLDVPDGGPFSTGVALRISSGCPFDPPMGASPTLAVMLVTRHGPLLSAREYARILDSGTGWWYNQFILDECKGYGAKLIRTVSCAASAGSATCYFQNLQLGTYVP